MLNLSGSETSYARWVRNHACPSDADRAAMVSHIARLSDLPRFLVVPLVRAGDPLGLWLSALEALSAQIYPWWQVVAPTPWAGWAAGALGHDHVLETSRPGSEPDGARRAFLAKTMTEVEGKDAGFVVPVIPGALLDERALYEFAAALGRHPRAAVLYADEDDIDRTSRTPLAPRFKTGFDPELMLGRDALGLPVAYRRSLMEGLGGLREGAGPIKVALHDLALRASQQVPAEEFHHIPLVLCHRLAPIGADPEWDGASARRAVSRHLESVRDGGASVHAAPLAPTWCRVERRLPEVPPLVSVIVPTRNRADLLARCVDGVLHRTDYPRFEVLIVDNGSDAPETLSLLAHLEADPRVRILRHPGPFNYSALNNFAARQARGEVLLLLNNDTDVISPGWLREMVAQALRPGVGAVGAKLFYADGRIQHAGIVLGQGKMIVPQLRLSHRDDPGPNGELALARTVMAVTGACVAVRRTAFWEVGGFDEEKLAVAFNDIDLCLRLGDHGYSIVWTPFAELLHLESASRGDENTDPVRHARFLEELGALCHRWAPELRDDPFHNPNIVYGFHGTELAWPPRRAPSWTA